MPDTKVLDSPYAPQEQTAAAHPDLAQPDVRLEKRLAIVLPLPGRRKSRQTKRKVDRYVYFFQLTDMENQPLPEYVGADLEIVNSCADLTALRTFDSPDLAIYFCRVYGNQFQHRRFRYRARRFMRTQCK
jgi:hypothetical protein